MARLGIEFVSASPDASEVPLEGELPAATALRLVELTDDYCALAVIEEGRIRWWRANDGFRERYRLWSGMELPEETVAGAVHRGERPEGKPVRVDAAAWGGPTYETDWWEDVVVTRYGQTLSLIRAG